MMSSVVSGVGLLDGIPATTSNGRAITKVKCLSEGSVAIDCKVIVPGVEDIMSTLTSSGTFTVAGSSEYSQVEYSGSVLPPVSYPQGNGRIIHPVLGAFDYQCKPDEWLNIDGDAVIAPTWASTKTLKGAAHSLWLGDIRDVVCEERWLGKDGLAMPASQMRMLLAIWIIPVDPTIGYVQWYPNYTTNIGYNVLPVDLVVGSAGRSSMARMAGVGYQVIVLDDVVNTKDIDGGLDGWITQPVTFFLKLVGRI
jgi:hypothetical protein